MSKVQNPARRAFFQALSLATAGTGATALAASAPNFELLMFEEEHCPWCEAWRKEVGVVYAKTEEGALAPLRKLDIFQRPPSDVMLKSRPQFSPTFILLKNGREFGRIEGYPGEDFFWGLLNQMLKKAEAN